MNSNPFKVGGALMPQDWPVYIERDADKKARSHLEKMDYITLIEPRQQGKSSLISRLMGKMGASSQNPDRPFYFALVDFTSFRELPEKKWYKHLGEHILNQLTVIPAGKQPKLPTDHLSWLQFLGDVGSLAEQKKIKVVLALDEVGAVPVGGRATSFFATNRTLLSYRQSMSAFNHITFILAGAHNPRLLIDDSAISPFNVAQEIFLSDFTVEQVKLLTGKLNDDEETQTILAERIHHWTDGQPYLTQWLCRYLVGQAKAKENVDEGVKKLRLTDSNHLPNVFEAFFDDEKLRDLVQQIANGDAPDFTPGELPSHMQLHLAGIIKADAEGKCKIRNRIYEQALSHRLSGGGSASEENNIVEEKPGAIAPLPAPQDNALKPGQEKVSGLTQLVNLLVQHGEFSQATVMVIFVVISALVAVVMFGLLNSTGVMTVVLPGYVEQANVAGAFVGFFLTLIVLFKNYNPHSPTITGNVLSADGNPVQGAKVFVIGEDRRKISDEIGWFKVEVKSQSKWEIVASYQGQSAKKIIQRFECHLPITLTIPPPNESNGIEEVEA